MSSESEEKPVEDAAAEPAAENEAPPPVPAPSSEAAVPLPEPEVETAVPAPVAQKDKASRKPPSSAKGRKERPSRRGGKTQPTLRQVTDRFAACGRCSYFWAGYRVLFGEEGLETAVNQSESGWLDLNWNLQMPDLVHKTYGVRLDVAHFHYEGCCDECRRHFVFEAAKNEDLEDRFHIEISPRMAK